ncbi:hypothetical protein JYQ62_19670 [Nostoc sp. UHCC 0702]|nr:hypothetical protein JYQ62_19670 [Nostoc sp. UHCC 0702]
MTWGLNLENSGLFSGMQSSEKQERRRREHEEIASRLNSTGIGSKWGGFQSDAGRVYVKDKNSFENDYNSFLSQARQGDEQQMSPEEEAHYRKGLEMGHWKGNPLAKKYGLEGMASPQENAYRGGDGIHNMFNDAMNASQNLFRIASQF